MKLLKTGANSYVGARIYLDTSKSHDVIGTYAHNKLSEKFIPLDITVEKTVRALVSEKRPDVIIHVAANANAWWCEAHPEEARVLNETATQYVVDAANSTHARVIYISSFGAISPAAVYGKTKHASESFVQHTSAGFLILRPSFILGYSPNTTNDRPFNRLLKNLDDGAPAVYDTSWKFQPTYLGHMSEVILACMKMNIWNEVIHVTVPELSTRFETARDI